jgi:hypothetical protein
VLRLTIRTIVAFALFTGCGKQQLQTNFYPDRAAAEAAGAIERGWFPEWMPNTAKELREAHDIDTNRSMLALRYDPTEIPRVPKSCVIRVGATSDPPFQVSWWAPQASDGAFACENGKAFLVLQVAQGRIWYWRP